MARHRRDPTPINTQDGVKLAVQPAYGHVVASPGSPPDLF
jgi:hypothetical protein